MKRTLLSVMAAALATGALLLAQDGAKGVINKRQENQKDRIKAGAKDGSLTKGEAAELRARERAVKAKEARDRADGGGFTNKEKARIQKQQDRISKDIYKERRDGQTRK